MLTIGSKAPDFALPDQDNQMQRLSDYAGKWVVVYFYPKDNTPGCTKEALSFRDRILEFKNRNVVVFGISKDSPTSHQKFSIKYQLNFPILADPQKKVIDLYQADHRVTYLIDPHGEIFKTYPKVDPLTHTNQVLADLPTN